MLTPCESCGLQAPTRRVNFYQNIGMVFSRSHSEITGNFCRRCIRKYFKSYTLTTLFLGWWGLISFIVTPFMLLFNIVDYLRALSLPEPDIAAMDSPLAASGIVTGGDRSFKFKVIYGVIIWTIALVLLLQEAPKMLEKYAPKFNAYLHSGTPTTEADIDYRTDHLLKAFEAYGSLVGAACPEKASFKQCRAQMLNARPALDDMGIQYKAMENAWATEKRERSIPDSCKIPMDQYFSSIDGYWTTEDRALKIFASIDPDSKDSIRTALPQLQQIQAQEDGATEKLQKAAQGVSAGSPCKDY